LHTFLMDQAPVLAVAFSPDARLALSGHQGGELRLWDVSARQGLRLFSGHESDVIAVAFSRDGNFALSGSKDKLRLWEAGTGRCLRTIDPQALEVHAVAFSPDGRFALCGHDQSLSRWECLWDERRTAPLALSRSATVGELMSAQERHALAMEAAAEALAANDFGLAAQHLRQARLQPGY